MAKKSTMYLTEDDSALREVLGRALLVENVQIVPSANAFSPGPDTAENPFFQTLLEMDLGTEAEWDTFYTI